MISWTNLEYGEGVFKGKIFRNDGGDSLRVYANADTPDFADCAEKCVEAFNNLSEPTVNEICKKIIDCAKKDGEPNKNFELPALNNPLDILNYCWFAALYSDMGNKDDEIAYAVGGEGEWGENIGFYIRGNNVVYVGEDFWDYMQNG